MAPEVGGTGGWEKNGQRELSLRVGEAHIVFCSPTPGSPLKGSLCSYLLLRCTDTHMHRGKNRHHKHTQAWIHRYGTQAWNHPQRHLGLRYGAHGQAHTQTCTADIASVTLSGTHTHTHTQGHMNQPHKANSTNTRHTQKTHTHTHRYDQEHPKGPQIHTYNQYTHKHETQIHRDAPTETHVPETHR